MLPSPGFEEAAGLVLPVLRHREQLLKTSHGFLHGRMRGQADSLVDEPPHGLQTQGGGLGAGLLHGLQPASLLQPHSQAGQLGQVHVELEADVQQALDLGDARNLVGQDFLAVLLKVFDTVQEHLKDDNIKMLLHIEFQLVAPENFWKREFLLDSFFNAVLTKTQNRQMRESSAYLQLGRLRQAAGEVVQLPHKRTQLLHGQLAPWFPTAAPIPRGGGCPENEWTPLRLDYCSLVSNITRRCVIYPLVWWRTVY